MKQTNIIKFLFILFLPGVIIYSCKKDEDFHQISALEQQIHQKINDHRLANQLNTLVFQPLLFKEARTHSLRMIKSKSVTADGLDAVFDDLRSKIGGTNAGYILDINQYAVADSIMKQILSDVDISQLTLDTFTQAGIGVAADADKINYITILFLNIP